MLGDRAEETDGMHVAYKVQFYFAHLLVHDFA